MRSLLRRPAFLISLLSGSLLFVSAALEAQNRRECATVISAAQRAAEMKRLASPQVPFAEGAVILPYHLPLAIHICRKTDGTGGFTLGQLDTAMADLNRLFNQAGIQFFQYGEIIYINSDNFYSVPDSARRAQLRMQNVVANTINVYFTDLVTECGQASFPGDAVQGILVDGTCAGIADNPSSFAHEVGHYLNLYHTHETRFGMECPSGGNCSTAGDLVCDTPADPNVSDSVNASCDWTGTARAASGCDATLYAPQTNNMMSYSRKTCRTLFTTSQIDRMLTTLGPLGSRANLYTNVKYVDGGWNGTQLGTPHFPFKTVTQALDASADDNFVFIKSASYPEVLVTPDRRVTLERWDASGTVIVGALPPAPNPMGAGK